MDVIFVFIFITRRIDWSEKHWSETKMSLVEETTVVKSQIIDWTVIMIYGHSKCLRTTRNFKNLACYKVRYKFKLTFW